jgi:homoserine O-acetyltransferase
MVSAFALWVTLAQAPQQFADLGTCLLESGQTLRECRIGYRTYGQMNADRSNVILFPSWFNGTTENLETYVGAQGFADSGRYFVVTVDAIGNGVSISPSNSESQKGQLFPRISMGDMVESQRRLLMEKLGVSRVYAVMGISMGGMQTFQWMARHPDFLQRAVVIVGTPKMSGKDILLWTTFMKGINLGGRNGAGGNNGNQKKRGFWGALWGAAEPALVGAGNAQLEDMLAGGSTAPRRNALPIDKNPTNVLRQFDAMLAHDISRLFQGSLEQAAQAVRARTLVVVATQDKAVSPDTPLQFAQWIRARTFTLTGTCGHNAYKCERETLAPEIRNFLNAP